MLLSLLRLDGVDFLTSNAGGNGGRPDHEQLAFCATARRVILTFDRSDFQQLHTAWMRQGREHACIIIVTRALIPVTILHAALMRLQTNALPKTW